MTSTEFEYVKRALKQLEGTIPMEDRIKIQRTLGQIFTRSAERLERALVDSLE
jgi:hypothetical protein